MRRLFAAVALAPLTFAAHGALAQTTIGTATTTPVATSTTGNLTINGAGSITVTNGVAVTVDSSNTVTNTGLISVRDSTAGTGILVNTAPGRTGGITLTGTIAADDTANNVDVDNDGDLDGRFVNTGVVRYGVRIVGSDPFTGNLSQDAGAINVEGNDGSAGISIETGLIGNLTTRSNIGILGSDSFAIHVVGPVTGNVHIGGKGVLVSARGENAVGVAIDSPVSGALRFDGAVLASGFRYTSRTNIPVTLDKLDADDLLIGGPAVRIRGSVGGGVLIDAAPGEADEDDEDEDDDGTPDVDESTAALTSLGSAPGLLIAGPGAIVLGNVGTAAGDAYGLLIKGTVSGNGLFDGITSTGVQLGGEAGTVNTTGGIRVVGGVSATAYKADATGLWLKSGVTAPSIVNEGQISAGIEAGEGITPNARAIVIDQGASVASLTNSGTIRAGVTGPTGNATAIIDASGLLSSITTNGSIQATVETGDPEVAATGNRIALDLRANTTGVTLTQTATTQENFTSNIVGDVLFSAGAQNDTFDVQAGTVQGTIAFGEGSDNLQVGETARVRTDLRKTVGAFNLGVLGSLELTNTNQINVSTLGVGAKGSLAFTADPRNADASQRITFLNVAGAATLEAGSKVSLGFNSKLVDTTTYTVLRAGSLIDNGVDATLINSLPLIYSGEVTTTGNEINISVRRREANELGLSGGRAAAYNAFYAAFDADPAVAAAVFSKTNTADFNTLYDQFLPDYSGGPFNSLANGARSVLQTQGEQPTDLVAGEPRSWLQEVGVGVKHESVNDIEYQTGGFGIAGGIERPGGGENSAYGISAAFMSSEIRNAQRATGSVLTASAIMSSLYWRAEERGMILDASLSGGYAWFQSERRIVDAAPNGTQNLVRQPSADWAGGLAAARVGVAYNWEAGPFYIRHDAVLDAVYLREGSYTETGGGGATNLHVGSRTNYEAAAEAGILLGARFGRTFRWGPEVRVAYRGLLSGGEGDTTGNFVSVPGANFTLPGLAKDRNRIIVRAALRGSGAYSNVAFEATGDIGEVYQAYMARVLVRFLF